MTRCIVLEMEMGPELEYNSTEGENNKTVVLKMKARQIRKTIEE